MKRGWMAFVFAFIANCAIIIAANYLFIITIEHSGTDATIFANFFFGFFKAAYKKWILLTILDTSKWLSLKIKYKGAVLDEEDLSYIQTLSDQDLFMVSLLQIVNNIIIPLLLVILESKQCFYGHFFERPTLTVEYNVTYSGTRCSGSQECCAYDQEPNDFTFTPPFLYYSNCSNFLLTSYIPVMIITFTFTGVIFPIMMLYQDWFFDKYFYLPENPSSFETVCNSLVHLQLKCRMTLLYIITLLYITSLISLLLSLLLL